MSAPIPQYQAPVPPVPPVVRQRSMVPTSAMVVVTLVWGALGWGVGLAMGAASNGGSAAGAPVANKAAGDAAAAAKPAGQPASKATPQTVLNVDGSGIKTTDKFTTASDWDVRYTYDCSSFGATGNFMVSTEDSMPIVNELGAKGSSVTHQHASSGEHYLTINSECSWTVTVISNP